MSVPLQPVALEAPLGAADHGRVRIGTNGYALAVSDRTCDELPNSAGFPGEISQGAAGVEVLALKNRETPTDAEQSEVHIVYVSVPPPVPGVDIPWNAVNYLEPFPSPNSQPSRAPESWLSDDLVRLYYEMEARFGTYAREAEARLGELNRDRVRVARGREALAVRIHRLQSRVQAEHQGLLSATGDLYARALQGDAEALAVVWSADADPFVCIDELREILAAIAELRAQLETLAVWERQLTEIPTATRATTPSTEPPPPIPARDFVVSALTFTGPPGTA